MGSAEVYVIKIHSTRCAPHAVRDRTWSTRIILYCFAQCTLTLLHRLCIHTYRNYSSENRALWRPCLVVEHQEFTAGHPLSWYICVKGSNTDEGESVKYTHSKTENKAKPVFAYCNMKQFSEEETTPHSLCSVAKNKSKMLFGIRAQERGQGWLEHECILYTSRSRSSSPCGAPETANKKLHNVTSKPIPIAEVSDDNVIVTGSQILELDVVRKWPLLRWKATSESHYCRDWMEATTGTVKLCWKWWLL